VIDVLGPVTAAAHGGCVECDPTDDRGDDLFVFALGGHKVQLCRHHLAALRLAAARAEQSVEGASDRGVDVERLAPEMAALREAAVRYAAARATDAGGAGAGLDLETAAIRYVRKLDDELREAHAIDYAAIAAAADSGPGPTDN
jgi:hypothetical protein